MVPNTWRNLCHSAKRRAAKIDSVFHLGFKVVDGIFK